MKRQYRIKVNDMRLNDVFVRWPEEELGSEREVYVLRDTKPLPTQVSSMIQAGKEIYVLTEFGMWISLTTGTGYEPRAIECMDWTEYSSPLSVDRVKRPIVSYVNNVSEHNRIRWITDEGCRRIAEEIVKDLNGTY